MYNVFIHYVYRGREPGRRRMAAGRGLRRFLVENIYFIFFQYLRGRRDNLQRRRAGGGRAAAFTPAAARGP